MPLFIERNDITKMEVDAVVNSANADLKDSTSGVNHIIHKSAGEKLAEECSKLSPIKRGEAVITKGYNLKAKYIIHTLGPQWEGGSNNESAVLYNCYKNSLLLAKEKKLESIAFPLISSGLFGFPKDKALKIAEDAIRDFLFENDMDIYIIVFDKSAFKISSKLYFGIKEYIDDNYADAFKERRRQRLFESAAFESMENMAFGAPSIMQEKVAPIKATHKKQSIEDYLKTIDESFQEMLLRKIDEKGIKDSACYKKANIDRKHFSKIRKNKNYKPKKETALSLIIALELPLNEAEDMLKKAGYALSGSSTFDMIIKYFLENEIYDIFLINDTLFTFDQVTLSGKE